MTDRLMPWQKRQAVRDKLATMPPAVDAQGVARTPAGSEETAAEVATDPIAGALDEPAGMKPNPMQGRSGTPAPMQHTGSSPLENIRAKAADIARLNYDRTL